MSDISKAINGCMGYEITQQTKSLCTISLVSLPNINEFSAIEKRMFTLIQSLFRILGDDIKNKSVDHTRTKDSVLTIIRYCSFCRMIVTKTNHFPKRESIFRYSLYARLTHIVDDLSYFSKWAEEHQKKIPVELLEFFNSAELIIGYLYRAYYKDNKSSLEAIYSLCKKTVGDELASIMIEDSAIAYYYLADIIRNTEAIAGTVANLKNL